MIWKTVLVISIAYYALCEHEKVAVSEQKVTIHHLKSQSSDHSHGDKNSEHHEEYAWAYPSYEFSYKVNDPHTHDVKGQNEERHGDEVKGVYWLLEPNGHKRTVNYHANDHKGFNAQVECSPSERHGEHSNDNYQYSVYEKQIEEQVEHKDEENNNETDKIEEVKNEEEKIEENNEEINKEQEENEDEKNIEKNNDNYKESESNVAKSTWIAKAEGDNVEVIGGTNEFNINSKDDEKQRLAHIQQRDLKKNIHKNHREGNDKNEMHANDKNEKHTNQSQNKKRIKLNNHNDEFKNKHEIIRQEKSKQRGKHIGNNNSNHKNTRRKEEIIKINEAGKNIEHQNDETKDKINKINSSKITQNKNDDSDNQNNVDNKSEIYEHRIFINHPKFSTSVPKEKRHRH